MGFYGNITNTARTQFQFDKIYPNRTEMDVALNTGDGIQIGRYVLVNYNPEDQTEEDNYDINFEIDKNNYGSARGYDSTVWQKVYTNGTEKYVMVAELNTITPIFTIAEADAPQIVPIAPHFGDDSSNIFYKLHWSPTWGFRVKAANSALEGPVLEKDGSVTRTTTLMSDDSIDYPSDERTYWHKSDGTIFGVGEGENSGTWVTPSDNLNDYLGVPAAIYYNKDGFDPAKISYGYREIALISDTYKKNTYYIKQNGVYQLAKTDFDATGETTYYEKIEDHIQIAPTGYSGHKYNSLEFDQDGDGRNESTSVQPDTQELSIMLPAIGDTIAAVWDLIYGGENVNGGETRNLDIKWESAKAVLERKGLRLVTDFQSADQNTENKYDYKVKNVETLAGAINSVHDLMGMIIQTGNHTNLTESMSSLDENRIYYDSTTKTFNRKTKKYRFEPVEETVFEYVEKELTSTTYAPGLYYINDNGEYVIDNNELYDENQSYYVKKLVNSQEYTEIDNTQNNYVLFDGTQYAYRDYTEIVYNQLSSPFDFVRDPKYYEDKKYYLWSRVQNAMEGPCRLSDEYEPNRYYIKSGNNYVLDSMTTPLSTQHYTLKEANLRTLAQLGTYDKLYVPGQYVYENDQGIYVVDDSQSMTANRDYYSFTEKTVETEDDNRYILVNHYEPIDQFTESTPYVASKYWYYEEDEDENEENNYHLDENETITPGREYFKLSRIYKKLTSETTYYERTGTALNLYQFRENCFFTRKSTGFYAISSADVMKDLNNNEIYVLKNTNSTSTDGTYTLTENDLSNESVSAILKTDDFYTAGSYYYEAYNHDDQRYSSYILDLNEQKTADRDYYKIDYTKLYEPVVFEGEGAVVYERNKYYYEVNGRWRLDNFPTPFYPERQYYQDTSQRLENIFEFYKYYEKVGDEYRLITSLENNEIPSIFYKRDKAYYVLEDLSGVFKKGAVWNRNMAIPPTVTLATRSADEDSYVLEPLPGFARDITTMHGLILKIKALLDNDNETTRDTRTVQGALNTLNDKIAQLDTWQPGQFIIVDDYGRFHGAEIKGVQGMTVTVDSNPEQPAIEFGLNLDGTDTDAIDVGEIKLGAYSLNEENTGAIETGDSLKKALNKLENADVYQHPYDEIEVEKTRTISEDIPNTDDLATQREYFWEQYHFWLNDYNGSKTLYTYSLQDSTSLIVYQIDESIFDENDLVSNIYTYNESIHTLIPVTNSGGESGELSAEDYYDNPTVAYYRPWEILLNEQFFPIIIGAAGLVYNDPIEGERSLTTSELWQMYLDGEDYDPGTHSESHTETYTEIETLYEPYTLGDTVEKVLTLEENYNYFDENTEFEYEVKPYEEADSNTQIFWQRYNSEWRTITRSSGTFPYYINGYLYRPNTVTSETFVRNTHCYFDSQYHVFVFPLNYSTIPSQWYQYDSYQIPITLQFPMIDNMIPFKVGKGTPENIKFLCLESWLNIMNTKETYTKDTYIVDPSKVTQVPIYYRENDEWIQTDEYNMNRTYYIAWQALFDANRLRMFSDIYTNTKEKAFKTIELTSTTYTPWKYYQKINNEFILDAQNAVYDSTATYYELQNPIVVQEREVVTPSLFSIYDTLYGVGSLYNTSTNVGVETETDSGIYTLPNMPGEWELIHKAFKYYSYAIEGNDNEYGIVWDDTTTQDGSETSLRRVNIIRNQSGIEIRLRWYNKITYYDKDADQHIVSIPLSLLGLNSGWNQYITCESDGTASIYMLQASFSSGTDLSYAIQETISNTERTQTVSGVTTPQRDNINSVFLNTTTIIPDEKQMLDSDCDQFTWKRIS